MVFSSPRYLVFLTVVLLLLSVPLALRWKKRVLVVMSSLFYAAWDYRYLGLLVLISIIDYIAAERIHRAARQGGAGQLKTQKAWLTASVVSNLAILGYFKYCNFFLHNLNGVLGALGTQVIPYQEILLPAGISFYTFKSMSYTIDVYRKVIEPCEKWLDYLMFVTFFPELIAGPIVRASVFLPQMARIPRPTAERLRVGIALFVMGLLKKRVIADNLATTADQVFAAPHMFATATLWLGLLAYTLQIYCDFSGYSDMAIGSAKMMGYDLPENFRMPYLSGNITEFWRRWHMTLSNWLRDYLYIPLGGNRRGPRRTYVNLFLTMLLGGLWHGASWNFVLWGALHGTALAVHKLFRARVKWRMPGALGMPLTLLFAALCWIPFRAPSFGATLTFLKRLFVPSEGVQFLTPVVIGLAIVVAIGHLIGGMVDPVAETSARPDARSARSAKSGTWLRSLREVGLGIHVDEVSGWVVVFKGGTVLAYAMVTILAFSILFGAVVHSSPFIYFQF